MENRIEEQQLALFADRTSCHVFLANQVRVYLSGFAYVVLGELRRIAMSGAYPYPEQLFQIWARLQPT